MVTPLTGETICLVKPAGRTLATKPVEGLPTRVDAIRAAAVKTIVEEKLELMIYNVKRNGIIASGNKKGKGFWGERA